MKKIGALERTRTSTPLRELEPESSASASSATRALVRCERARREPASHCEAKLFCPGLAALSTRRGSGETRGRQRFLRLPNELAFVRHPGFAGRMPALRGVCTC